MELLELISELNKLAYLSNSHEVHKRALEAVKKVKKAISLQAEAEVSLDWCKREDKEHQKKVANEQQT